MGMRADRHQGPEPTQQSCRGALKTYRTNTAQHSERQAGGPAGGTHQVVPLLEVHRAPVADLDLPLQLSHLGKGGKVLIVHCRGWNGKAGRSETEGEENRGRRQTSACARLHA